MFSGFKSVCVNEIECKKPTELRIYLAYDCT